MWWGKEDNKECPFLSPDPEVPEKARRRRFSARYKLKILEQAERCSQLGEVGALFRREGLYWSNLQTWRRQRENGSLPLLTPMSEVAGKMAVQEGAKYLEKTFGGKGVLLGGVTGVDSGTVLIIGGGIVGTNAAKIACGLGAKVYVLDNNLERLRYLSDVMPKNCFPLMSSPAIIRRLLKEADLVVGAVLIPGAVAPKLVTHDMLPLMKKGSVIVDVAIDQGGCVETAKPTTHDQPIYEVDGIIHYLSLIHI